MVWECKISGMIYLTNAYDRFNHCWDCAADPQWWKGVAKWGWEHPQTQRAWTRLKTPECLGAIGGVVMTCAVGYIIWNRYEASKKAAAEATGTPQNSTDAPIPIKLDPRKVKKPPDDFLKASDS